MFNKDAYFYLVQCYITDSECEMFLEQFPSNERNKTEEYDPPHNRVAMVLLINELFSVRGHVTYSNVCTILASHGINVEQTTIKQILEGTSEKRDKPYKSQPQHSKISSCLISLYCKEKNIRKTPSNVAQILNDLSKSSPRAWGIVFTTEIAANIMKVR
ncbi:hypothetical protein ACU63U_10345 [Klebsiella aerogenes]